MVCVDFWLHYVLMHSLLNILSFFFLVGSSKLLSMEVRTQFSIFEVLFISSISGLRLSHHLNF